MTSTSSGGNCCGPAGQKSRRRTTSKFADARITASLICEGSQLCEHSTDLINLLKLLASGVLLIDVVD